MDQKTNPVIEYKRRVEKGAKKRELGGVTREDAQPKDILWVPSTRKGW